MVNRYVNRDEPGMACPCCGENRVDDEAVGLADEAREEAGIPFIINSGYRCRERNSAVGGRPNSAHLGGVAFDIAAERSRERFTIVRALQKVGFRRIGVYSWGVHADTATDKPQDVLWVGD